LFFGKKIKSRMIMLGKTQTDLIAALHDRGYAVTASALSQWLSGTRKPRNPAILVEIDMIITKWERANRFGSMGK
jgi:transcriptional regulator with XRE-family HTH domain